MVLPQISPNTWSIAIIVLYSIGVLFCDTIFIT